MAVSLAMRAFTQMMLKWLIAALIIYGGFVALLYLAQRSLQYFPEPPGSPRISPTYCQRCAAHALSQCRCDDHLCCAPALPAAADRRRDGGVLDRDRQHWPEAGLRLLRARVGTATSSQQPMTLGVLNL